MHNRDSRATSEQAGVVAALAGMFMNAEGNQAAARSSFSLAAIIGLVAIIEGGVIGYMVSHPPKPGYFASTADGRIIPIVPLSEPMVGVEVVAQLANDVAIASYSFDFQKYQLQLSQLSKYMTAKAYSDFIAKLYASGIVKDVVDGQMLASATAAGAAVQTRAGLMANGVYMWEYQVPVLVTLQGRKRFDFKLIATVTMQRSSVIDNTRGVEVSAIVFTKI